MKSALATLSLFGLLGSLGCSDRGAPAAVQIAESYQTLACACKDAACTKEARDGYAAASERIKGAKPTAAETTRIVELVTKAEGCAVSVGLSNVH